MSIKTVVAVGLFSCVSLVSLPSYAGTCGTGRIIEVSEGQQDNENFNIKIAISGEENDKESNHQWATFGDYWIRFRKNALTADRLQSIRAVAYLAFVSGKNVRVWTHNTNGTCDNATELSVFTDVDPT